MEVWESAIALHRRADIEEQCLVDKLLYTATNPSVER